MVGVCSSAETLRLFVSQGIMRGIAKCWHFSACILECLYQRLCGCRGTKSRGGKRYAKIFPTGLTSSGLVFKKEGKGDGKMVDGVLLS